MEGQQEASWKSVPATEGGIPACIVTGLSGAGKSTVLRVFEDMGFFTVDGLPASLAPDMMRLLSRMEYASFRGIALGMDVRQGDLLDIEQTLVRLALQGVHPRLVFVTADMTVLMRRYAATRRPHPLEREGMGFEAALEAERQRLHPLLRMADIILDTGSFSIHDLRRAVQQNWGEAQGLRHTLKVNLISFGFKYGVPKEADVVFDLRFLPNPYFVEDMRPLSGKDAAVRDYVFAQPWAREFRARFFSFVQCMLP
ncbi:MAG: RNase adapter RapZ, partial [Deltaproteobacteria bacterium]|nr:RNase adapter RapZ [Deltaproteobacteria bacterium]